MEAACPVHGNVTLLAIQPGSPLHGGTRANAAKLKEAVNDGAVVPDVVFSLLFLVRIHIIGSDLLEEIDVLVSMELRHLHLGGRFCALVVESR